MKRSKYIGNRVIKTAISIFITAWICELLNWPPVFAVITAIVTIEPTVSDSIKKGIVRFPASAIGSAYAVIFISFFGNSPITYTLAAFFTIFTCFKLRIHAGLLVATLTSVAMVEVIHSNLFIAFLIRLGTTSIGLIVSTVVNMFVWPPDYTKEIKLNIRSISKRTALLIEKIFQDILEGNHEDDLLDKNLVKRMDNNLTKTERLMKFQKEESKYHPLVGSERDKFIVIQSKLNTLRLLHYHLDNLIQTPLEPTAWTKDEKSILIEAVSELTLSLRRPSSFDIEKHHKQKRYLMTLFWDDNSNITKSNGQYPTYFPPELIILYELLSIYNQVENFYKLEDEKNTTEH